MNDPKSPAHLISDHDMDNERLTTAKKQKQPALGRDIQAKIGQQLRSYYDTLVEPVPDRFADLVRQLAASQAATASKKEGSE